MYDKKILHTVSISTLVALSISFFADNGGRILAAVFLIIAALATCFFIKKRGVPSFYDKEVAMLMAVIAAVYVMLYYLTGLQFGFVKSDTGFGPDVILTLVIPIVVMIVLSEIMRNIILAQQSRFSDVVSYLAFVVGEVVIHYTASEVYSFNKFMDVVGLVLLPAFISNLLYHYVSKRYGVLPNIVYRLITILHLYLIPFESKIADSLLAFVNLILPIFIYVFIDYLYEKKRMYALKNKYSKVSVFITAALVFVMSLMIMLISNTFQFGAYVIATDSMTGELNKGDIAIYEEYDGQVIKEGQVVVYNSNGNNIIHRVVEIENINGQNRYYTKGDVNEELDPDYITDSNIRGLVNLKLPYLGFPTLWLREFIYNTL